MVLPTRLVSVLLYFGCTASVSALEVGLKGSHECVSTSCIVLTMEHKVSNLFSIMC